MHRNRVVEQNSLAEVLISIVQAFQRIFSFFNLRIARIWSQTQWPLAVGAHWEHSKCVLISKVNQRKTNGTIQKFASKWNS